jgi:hypothetical protein
VVVLVVGADEFALRDTLAGLGEDDGAIVLDPSAAALEEVERAVRDPRVWYQIGDGDVVPLPDRSVDRVLGDGPDVARVRR